MSDPRGVGGALGGILVADFSRILAGPLCSQLLSDAGARVVKVEQLGRGDETRRWGPPFVAGESAYFLSLNRNKESIELDLKHPRGREVAARLIQRADVVLQNFQSRQQIEFGLDAASVHAVNPRAIHCSIRGFDAGSEEADLPGYDLLAQAAGGIMAITGSPDGMPMKVGVALSDVLTAHHAHGAILAALYERERGGRARALEISLVGATEASMVNVAQNYLLTGQEPRRLGNEHPSIVPYQAFEASDRSFVVAVATDRHFALLCERVLGDAALAADERFTTNAARVANRGELLPLLEARFRQSPAESWVAACRDCGIPAALVRRYAEIFSRSPLLQRTEHPTVGPMELVGSPIRVDGQLLSVRSAPPLLGQNTEAILRELGFEDAEVQTLRAEGAVGAGSANEWRE